MPMISNEKCLPSTSSRHLHSVSKREYAKKSDSDPDITEKIATVNNHHDELFFQTHRSIESETKKGVWYYLSPLFCQDKKRIAVEEIELNKMLAEGQALRQDAERVTEQLQQASEVHPPVFSLKTKTGLLMGAVLIVTGSVGLYMRRTSMNEYKEGFSSDNSFRNTEEMKKYNNTKSNVISLGIMSDDINIHNKRAVVSVITDEKYKKTDNERYELTDQTLERCRDHLLNYLNIFSAVDENTTDKEMAYIMLSLIHKDPTQETELARISLYRSGLYGEKKGEPISSNVQQQLVNNLLSLLLYGQSSDDYLINVFSKNRYVSIKDFASKVVKNEYGSDQSSGEMSYFYANYLNSTMPLLSLKLSEHSNILVGSVSWFLVYLSSVTEWVDAKRYDESKAIMQGFKILQYFLSGDLEETSKIKINFGLKFCALYFNTTLTPKTLPGFSFLWDIYYNEYVKHENILTSLEEILVKISSDIKSENIESQDWISQNKFAENMLQSRCLRKYPFLYYKRNDQRERINVREFINSTTEHVWCIRHQPNDNKTFQIKLPIIKYEYERLLANALKIIDDINRFCLSVAFTQNDYFNVGMDWDEFSFINKSALKVVTLEFSEIRTVQTNPYMPKFKNTHSKETFSFFTATYDNEQRIYAIDITHRQPLQRVRNSDEYIIKSKAQFFDVEHRNFYKDKGIVVKENRMVNISISRKEPTSLFIEKIINQQREKLQMIINKNNDEFLYLDEVILQSIKDILIPFYSCVTSVQQGDLFDSIISCLADFLFIVVPTGKVVIKTMGKLTERMVDIGLLIRNNKIFHQNGRINWRKVINDPYVYNTVSNERSMLNTVFLKLFLDNVDPGVGVVKDISKMFKSTALNIMRGELVRLPFIMVKQLSNIFEFGIRIKSIIDSSRKVIIKASKPSGRLATGKGTGTLNQNGEIFSHPLYDSAYQFGDYYVCYSDKYGVELLMGITEEKTKNDEYIYVILGEDEFQGVLFRFFFRDSVSGEPNLIPWLPLETNVERINFSSRRNTTMVQEVKFNHDVNNPFNSIIYYPKYLCYLSIDNLRRGDVYDIYRINNIHYLFFPEGGYLRPVYDGDDTQIYSKEEAFSTHYIMKDGEGNLIIRKEQRERDSRDLRPGIEYIFNMNDNQTDYTYRQAGMFLRLDANELFLKVSRYSFRLGLMNIKNQFVIRAGKHDPTSFIVAWDSVENEFVPAKPYLKKTSSHVGNTLENEIAKYCEQGDILYKYPTLLLGGAVSYTSELKLKVRDSYYPLEHPVNGIFYLKCSTGTAVKSFTLFYDLFSESFEFILPDYFTPSPYEILIKYLFPVYQYPDMIDLIDLNNDIYNDKLKMRLHQAAFLQRCNPVDRMDTLLLPIAQIYSWELHHDTLPFQRLYPAAALWMTWQRQLHQLIKNNFPYELPLVEKIQLQSKNENIANTNGLLINSRYTDDEAIWISNNERDMPIIFYSTKDAFYTKELEIKNGARQWIPTVKYSHPLSVTQFMYEKDIHPKIIKMLYHINVKVADCHRFSDQLNIDFKSEKRAYFIISPGGEWVASIDEDHQVIIYNLWDERLIYLMHSEYFVFASNSFALLDFHPNDYHLLMLSDDGSLYYPKDNTWHDSKQNKYLWSPPISFFPSFFSHDHRFMGFKNKENFDVILYDQKRKLATLLKRPQGASLNGNITAISFSALNAVVALAFDDGEVYLYDLISERKEFTINPIASVKLNNTINNKKYNNILMRFEGIFNSLTIIHPEGEWNSSSQVKDVTYTRSRYGFHNAAPSD